MSNKVTAKKVNAPAAGSDSMVNAELASKAMVQFKSLIASGKNAQVLNDVANTFVNKKTNSTTTAFTKDGLIRELQQKVFQCHTLAQARKITQNDNYGDYLKFIKLVLSKKQSLNDNQKGQIKTIVATAQVLRNGFLSKYAHDELSWSELQFRYGIEEKTAESVTNPDQAPTETQPEAQQTIEQASTVNMETLKSLFDQLSFDDAALAMELLKAHMANLAQPETQEKAA